MFYCYTYIQAPVVYKNEYSFYRTLSTYLSTSLLHTPSNNFDNTTYRLVIIHHFTKRDDTLYSRWHRWLVNSVTSYRMSVTTLYTGHIPGSSIPVQLLCKYGLVVVATAQWNVLYTELAQTWPLFQQLNDSVKFRARARV